MSGIQFPVLTSHSQITWTCQPAERSFSVLLASLAALLEILEFQKSTLLLERAIPYLQACPCQKQPLMKMILFRDGKARSGLPGKELLCKTYRKPSLCNVVLTIISGSVSLLRMRAISWLRWVGEIRSIVRDRQMKIQQKSSTKRSPNRLYQDRMPSNFHLLSRIQYGEQFSPKRD